MCVFSHCTLAEYLVAALSNSSLFSWRSVRKWCFGAVLARVLDRISNCQTAKDHGSVIRGELLCILAIDNIQNNKIGNNVGIRSVLAQCLLERGLCFLETTQMNLCNCLGDETLCGGCRRRLCEFLKDVECLLVLLPAL